MIRPLSLCIRPAVATSVATLTVVVWFADASALLPSASTIVELTPGTVAVWDWPVDAPRHIIRPFIAPASAYGAGHRGIDIGVGGGSSNGGGDLLAPADGTVHFAGVVVDRPVLSIDHGGGVLSSYEPVETDLEKGDFVRRGEVIGEIQPGHCSDPCVHLGVRVNRAYVSPLLYLGGLRRSILLPTRFPDGVRGGKSLFAVPGREDMTHFTDGSGSGMSEGVGLFEPFRRDVGVDLGRSEARVAQHLLHGPQVRSPVEQVGRGGVP